MLPLPDWDCTPSRLAKQRTPKKLVGIQSDETSTVPVVNWVQSLLGPPPSNVLIDFFFLAVVGFLFLFSRHVFVVKKQLRACLANEMSESGGGYL